MFLDELKKKMDKLNKQERAWYINREGFWEIDDDGKERIKCQLNYFKREKRDLQKRIDKEARQNSGR